MKSPEREQWLSAMKEELDVIHQRDVWTLVEKTPKAKVLGCKWVFSVKTNASGQVERFKARLVAQGFRQIKGESFDEVFSPVVNFGVIKFFFALLVSLNKWTHVQCDVKGAYLYAPLTEEILMAQPTGFEEGTNLVCKLKKAIYGLHQSGREWYFKINKVLVKYGFTKFKWCNCVYRYGKDVVLLLYVDDIVVIGRTQNYVEEAISLLKAEFDLKILGKTKKLLGVEFVEENGQLYLHQGTYIRKVCEQYKKYAIPISSLPITKGMVFSKRQSPQSEEEVGEMVSIPYRNLIGSLAFLAGRTRPDISYALNIFSQFQESPGMIHWEGLLKLLGYVSATRNVALNLSSIKNINLNIFSDADFASNRDDRTSMGGQIIFLDGVPIAWRAFKQKCVSLSSMESEFVAMTEAVKELFWFRNILSECIAQNIIPQTEINAKLLADNRAAIDYVKSPIENYRTKHIDVKLFFIRDYLDQNIFELQYVPSKENLADVFTKPLTKMELERFKARIFFNL